MKLILLFIMTYSTSLLAKNYALFFSGDDAEKKEENQFFEHYRNKTDSFSKAGWETEILYGDEAESKFLETKAPSLKDKVKPATRTNVLSFLDKMIANGAKGDQVMLNINGHGGNGTFELSGSTLKYNDSEILDRLKQINDRGIKLAVAVETCYGGSSIPSFSPYACVVTSQSNNSVGYSGPARFAFDKVLKKPSSNMNDFYLQLLNETVEHVRMVPMTSASTEADDLASISTGLFRKEESLPSWPEAICYGPEAIQKLENSFKPITQMLAANTKFKRICKIFGNDNCKTQADLAAKLKKIKIKDLDSINSELEVTSDAKLRGIDKCFQKDTDLFLDREFVVKLDLKDVLHKPNESYPGQYMVSSLTQRIPSIINDSPNAPITQSTIKFRGDLCSIGGMVSPESINNLASQYAKEFYGVGPEWKTSSEAEFKVKLKKIFTKAFSSLLTQDQKDQLARNKDVVMAQYAAEVAHQKALAKHQQKMWDLDTGLTNQGLAYRFLDEGDHVPEKDKLARQRCEDFKLK